jgi:hypothetical protein
MNDRVAPFRYRLAPLLRRDEWERDALALEVERARRSFEVQDALYKASLARVAGAESAMREMHRADQPIALERRRMLQLHLEHEYAASALRQSEAKQAERVLDQLRAQFESKRLAASALQKHRGRQAQLHATEQERRLHRLADDLWLGRRRR